MVQNGVSEKRKQTAQKIIDALHESKGLLTLAAQKTGLSYSTLAHYAQEFPTVAAARREAKESVLDVAESKLFEAIQSGKAWAICFYLKTQGKERGYIERQEVTGAGGEPIAIKTIEARLSQ